MDRLIARHHRALFENGIATVEIGGKTARFAHEKKTGGEIPGRQAALPKAVEAARGNPRQIERGRAGAADPGDGALHGRKLRAKALQISPPAMRDAAAYDAIGEFAPCRHAKTAIVEIGALPALADISLVGDGIVDDTRHRHAFPQQRDRDREQRNAVEEIGGAVERIDDPYMLRVGSGDAAALLHQETERRPRFRKLAIERLLRTSVGGRY